MIRFRYQNGFTDSMTPRGIAMLERICPHEVGHLEVAHYFNSYLHGIVWAQVDSGYLPTAISGIRPDLSLKQKGLIDAAGSAGEILSLGDFTEAGASGDRAKIANSGYLGSYEKLVEDAVSILRARRQRFDRLLARLWEKLESNDVLEIRHLPEVHRVGAYVLNADEVLLEDEADAPQLSEDSAD